eukprot:10125425-Alexandrium_andersonii.AAC.1
MGEYALARRPRGPAKARALSPGAQGSRLSCNKWGVSRNMGRLAMAETPKRRAKSPPERPSGPSG